jgi:hypothetical protein
MPRRLLGIEGSRVDLPQKRQTPSDLRREAHRLPQRIKKATNEKERKELYAEKLRFRLDMVAQAEQSDTTFHRSRFEGTGGPKLHSPHFK